MAKRNPLFRPATVHSVGAVSVQHGDITLSIECDGAKQHFRLPIHSARFLTEVLAEELALYRRDSMKAQFSSSDGIPSNEVSPPEGHSTAPAAKASAQFRGEW